MCSAGDEIKSTVSDTWSTDVLASDSEPPDQNQLDRLEEVAEENFMRPFMLSARDAEVGWCFCWCSVFFFLCVFVAGQAACGVVRL